MDGHGLKRIRINSTLRIPIELILMAFIDTLLIEERNRMTLGLLLLMLAPLSLIPRV